MLPSVKIDNAVEIGSHKVHGINGFAPARQGFIRSYIPCVLLASGVMTRDQNKHVGFNSSDELQILHQMRLRAKRVSIDNAQYFISGDKIKSRYFFKPFFE